MQFCKFCHPFPPAHNGLPFRKGERVLTCVQSVLHACGHGASVYGLIRITFGKSGVCTDVNSRGKILLNEIRTRVNRSRMHYSNHQAVPSPNDDDDSERNVILVMASMTMIVRATTTAPTPRDLSPYQKPEEVGSTPTPLPALGKLS